MQPVLPHRETSGAKLFEGSYRVRIVAAPREVAGAGLGQHRQVDAKETVNEMCGTEQGQIQLQKVPGQEGQDRSASEQAKGLRWGSRRQKETREKGRAQENKEGERVQQALGMLSLRGCTSLLLWRRGSTAPGTPSRLGARGESEPRAEIQAYTNGAQTANSHLFGGTGLATLYRVGLDVWRDQI